jgi:hypothetical protein
VATVGQWPAGNLNLSKTQPSNQRGAIIVKENENAFPARGSMSTSNSLSIRAIAPEYLEAYAEQDARAGCPNPRFKQSSIYCSRYLAVRADLVGPEHFSDAEWDLTIF